MAVKFSKWPSDDTRIIVRRMGEYIGCIRKRKNGWLPSLNLSAAMNGTDDNRSRTVWTKFAAEYVERRSPSWKPSTVKATMSYLNSAILPALGHLRVGSVGPTMDAEALRGWQGTKFDGKKIG